MLINIIMSIILLLIGFLLLMLVSLALPFNTYSSIKGFFNPYDVPDCDFKSSKHKNNRYLMSCLSSCKEDFDEKYGKGSWAFVIEKGGLKEMQDTIVRVVRSEHPIDDSEYYEARELVKKLEGIAYSFANSYYSGRNDNIMEAVRTEIEVANRVAKRLKGEFDS